MPTIPAPLSARATSAQQERGGHWEPCGWPTARREAGAAHRAHCQPQAGEKRVERHLLLPGVPAEYGTHCPAPQDGTNEPGPDCRTRAPGPH